MPLTPQLPSEKAGAPPVRAFKYGLLCAGLDGSLSAIIPVNERNLRRLEALQGRLTEALPHAAGLNPRAYREFRRSFKEVPITTSDRMIDCELVQE